MGSYTALDDPSVDQVIECHMQRIVEALTSRMSPDAIVLRGSFGRGEGSVMPTGAGLRFLSDYEIDVATYSPLHRSLFAELSKGLSAEFGMEAGMRWTRPDCLLRDRIGPLPLSSLTPSISLYEFRYGSRVLYGRDFISSAPAIESTRIPLQSGIQLVLNRMAESLYYMPAGSDSEGEKIESCHWINKTMLAFAEALLLLWKQYHYSYAERGCRFAMLADQGLRFMSTQADELKDLVARATEFKLRPRLEIYPDSVQQTWLRVIPVCDAVFRHLIQQAFNISVQGYAAFPAQFLDRAVQLSGTKPSVPVMAQQVYELYRSARARRWPRSIFSRWQPSQLVYSVVPLLFLSYCQEEQSPVLLAARHWLSLLGPLGPVSADPSTEWDCLRRSVTSAWKTFCY